MTTAMFAGVIHVEFGVMFGVEAESPLRGALEGEWISSMTVLMQSERPAAGASARPASIGLQRYDASRAALPGVDRGRF